MRRRKYVLNKNYRLRGWQGSPWWLEVFPGRSLQKLSPDELIFLLRCDGKTDIDEIQFREDLERYLPKGVVSPCPAGTDLLPEQKYFCYPNKRFRRVRLALTGRCNMYCKHCFNTAGVETRTVEPSAEDLLKLIAKLDECGVSEIGLTGGEPLLCNDLLSLTAEITRRGIQIPFINTNGYLLSEQLIDSLEAQGVRPKWFISFDGIGTHEWLRGVPGSEARVLKNIELLCRRGYYVLVHQCVWRDSLETVRPTVIKLKNLGISCYRLTTVEPSLRWQELEPGQSVSTEEWQEWLCDFLPWWYKEQIGMKLDVWGFWQDYRRSGHVRIVPDSIACTGILDQASACGDAMDMPFIDADGRLVFCLGMSGLSDAFGFEWGNVYRDDLHEMFTDSIFTKRLALTKGMLKEQNEECRSCPWNNRCSKGCRAEAMVQGNGFAGIDRRVCVFFKQGYFQRFCEIAERYKLDYDAKQYKWPE